MDWLGIVLLLVMFSAVIILIWLGCIAEAEEDRKAMEEISKFPPHVQAMLAQAYWRCKADQDRL